MTEVKVYGHRPEGAVGRMLEVAPVLGTVDTTKYLEQKGYDLGGLENYFAGQTIASEMLGESQKDISMMSGLDVMVAVHQDMKSGK